MRPLYFATTNHAKIQIAQAVCQPAGITIKPVALDIDEIQGEDAEVIVRDKARRACELFGAPILVSDDSWSIPALGGFPGAYMKSINQWFSPKDFLQLMDGKADRRIILHQYLAYTDGENITVFTYDLNGHITTEPRGTDTKSPSAMVTAMETDHGKTIAEVFEQDEAALLERNKNRPADAWHEFSEWYKTV